MRTSRFPLLALTIVTILGCAVESPPPEVAEAPPRLENGSFTAELNGFRIHYEVHGTGPVLMTLPNSWGLSLEGLRGLYAPLEEHLTMVYFDPRGMGASDPIREDADMGVAAVRDDFDALRRHLGLDRVDAIGWSNGAMNLILLAAERPEILSSAIFLHGTAHFTEEDLADIERRYPDLMQAYGDYMKEMQDPETSDEAKDARTKQFTVEEFMPVIAADPDAVMPRLREMFADAEFSWRHSAYSDVEMPEFDGRDRLPLITARSLVIAGAHDMMEPRYAEKIHQGISDSTYELFEQSGHYAPVEEPERFVSTVLDFLGPG